MLTIKNLLDNLDLSKQSEFYLSPEFCREFNIDRWELNDEVLQSGKLKNRFTYIPIIQWHCTDTFVGIEIILLNSIPVCISSQTGRKMNIDYRWIDKEKFLMVKKYLEELKIPQKPKVLYLNLEEEFGDNFEIEYEDQWIPQLYPYAWFNTEKVKIERISSKDYIEKRVKIIFSGGEEKIVNVEELKFPLLNIKQDNYKLKETETWVLAHLARFPNMPLERKKELIAKLSSEAQEIAEQTFKFSLIK